ncbi:MAG: hypothetical protein A2776_00345 [Candidatus Levybacteria bacterium RIFCSPHIGHO2_01_FULL_40_10]|nr:MAG: hypothetical protein A2776_00345 [Candidatus Levybacteria bacterium RIFCSPHIGHO2_01_FULL_40_10]
MKARLVLLASYFIFTPLFIFSLIFYQLFLFHQDSSFSSKVLGAQTSRVEYSSLPANVQDTAISLVSREARIDVLRTFFARYNSPLEAHAEEIVSSADKYGLDYRLLPAIAMQESTLCQKAPASSHNCWGFGIYGTKKTAFDTYAEAIETISKALAKDYHGQGLIQPEQIMTKYTPSSDGSWAKAVSYVMDRIGAAL